MRAARIVRSRDGDVGSAGLRARNGEAMMPWIRARPGLAAASLRFALHLSSIVAAAAACEAVRSTAAGPWLFAPLWLAAAFLIGSRFRAFGNMLHECSHGTFVRGRARNELFGHLLAIMDFTSLKEYRLDHFSHHNHLGDPERDRDFSARRRLFEAEPGESFFRKHVLRPLLLTHFRAYFKPKLRFASDPAPVAAARLAFQAGLAALAHYVIGWGPFVLYAVIPYATTYQMFRYWSDAFDHAGVMGAADELDRSRNHGFSFQPLNWILFPRSDQFHQLHHLFPSIPADHLPSAHAELVKREASYRAMRHDMGFVRRRLRGNVVELRPIVKQMSKP